MRQLGLCLVGLGACVTIPEEPATPVGPATACIEAERTNIDFGEVDPVTQIDGALVLLEIRNLGAEDREGCGAPLEISSFGEISQPFWVVEVGELVVEPGESTQIALRFLPTVPGPATDRLVVRSNDPEQLELRIDLRGEGAFGQLELSPDTLDFGAPYLGCSVTREITLRNRGAGLEVVTSQELFTSALEEWSLAWADPDGAPIEIGPYDETVGGPVETLLLTYRPLDTFQDTAFLEVETAGYPSSHSATATGTGTVFGSRLERFEGTGSAQSDILIVVDRSSSMADNLASVQTNLQALAEEIVADPRDVRASVVVADDGCVLGGSAFVDGSMTATQARAAMVDMLDADGSRSTPGRLANQPIALAKQAFLAENVEAGGCNAGTFRAGTPLSVVVVTDGPLEGEGRSWAWAVGELTGLKATPSDVTIHVVGGDIPGGCPGADPASGLYEAVVSTGGVFASICATDFADDLWTGGVATGGELGVYDLSQQAVDGRIEVRVDGRSVRAGWTYDLARGAIVFDSGSEPTRGQLVEVDYQMQGPCN